VRNYSKNHNKKKKLQFYLIIEFDRLMNNIKYRLFFISGLLLLGILSSCSMERKLAQGFINNPPPISIQLFSPDGLDKFSHKGELIQGFDSLSNDRQDSALYYSSKFIQYIDDSIFLEKYINSFIDELRSLGFNVFVEESIDTFLKTQPQSYLLTISRVQLDEYIYPLEDSAEFGDSTFYKRFDLNAVDASSWFEISKMNTPKPVRTVLHSKFTATDSFDGKFVLNGFLSNVLYKYRIDSLNIQDLYDLAAYAGRKHASYLFDYFMNKYVAFHLPEGEEMQDYLHYDHAGKFLGTTDEDRFDIVTSN